MLLAWASPSRRLEVVMSPRRLNVVRARRGRRLKRSCGQVSFHVLYEDTTKTSRAGIPRTSREKAQNGLGARKRSVGSSSPPVADIQHIGERHVVELRRVSEKGSRLLLDPRPTGGPLPRRFYDVRLCRLRGELIASGAASLRVPSVSFAAALGHLRRP
jgi:hypothetical protein